MTPVCNTCREMIFGLVCEKAPKAGRSVACTEKTSLCCGRREEDCPRPPRAACRSELLPKKQRVSLEQHCPFPRQALHGLGTGPSHGFSHSRSWSSGAGWEEESKDPKGPRAKTPKEHSGRPQPSLPFCKAGKPGSAPNCTKSHPRDAPPSADGIYCR